MIFSDLIDRAAEFAAVAHRNQLRKSPEAVIPYVQHVLVVGIILQRAGLPEQVVAAGILHDVLEDTPVERRELEQAFGEEVAELVSSVSEQDKSLPWEVRKERYRERLRTASPFSRAITAADKLHNVNSIIRSLSRGTDIWKAFKRGRAKQLDRFERLVEALEDGWDHPLAAELRRAVERLKSLE